ncbi:O-acetylhomoserine aminocarboxypropyltransferase/cysteine synthase [Rathayibacter tritici]|uniref:trans-sulfuration enzyme family protein n=1 Tax=Rathayibacter tritici TaxID=33888 RepID=UPI000CE8BC91|nr:PLP-dependent transferase [Rathayibacter tritici]PPF30641.1 O-acetylhomoserine aminocarboxypropyltransferase/cysteine synthase [Rathayibacter tritici]PPF70799.1 O-acetylhomoserine aminocarboxypropyltransferase/cysteine synthase [Rathayibacter tritici]PPG08807.1 O-acetylhomoserine aminocarboxypropyltransferase/cysteine synthase [Rathayibacter tritici]PPI14890.1 O-acetylhomoserine aminocarboxypropyltransferase/cysteine synthase [Rathayibacter tritici]
MTTGMRFDTLASSAGYGHDEAARNQGSIIPPLYLTTAQHFSSAADMESALSGETDGWIYSRLGNPTVRTLEAVVAALEGYCVDGEVSAVATPSGMAAVTLATSPFLAVSPDGPLNIVASAACYGATFMVFSQRYAKERGVEVRWIPENASPEEWAARIDQHTRFVYAEVPANPLLSLVDIPALAAIAHNAGAPLIIDATLATPALMRPLGLGADIVVHALGKAAGASGTSLAGAVVARRGITSSVADPSVAEDFADYLRRGPVRDMGAVLSPFTAFMILNEIRDLRRRVDAMSCSALTIAEQLQASNRVADVFYPGLASHPSHELARQMVLVDSGDEADLVHRYGFLLSFRPVGGITAATRVFDRLKLVWRANDLGRVKSTATIPAIGTHRQVVATPGTPPIPLDLIRLSVGLEHGDDILVDLMQALETT